MEEDPTDAFVYQYPDPDEAAYATRYSWARDENNYVPAALQHDSPGTWRDSELDSDGGAHMPRAEWLSHEEELSDDDGLELEIEPDEVKSVHHESDEEQGLVGQVTNRQLRVPKIANYKSGPLRYREAHADQSSRLRGRRGRRGGLGRGARGIKKGLRNPVEPEPEFNALHSQATMAFIANYYDEAEALTLQALQINPEMYSAHNLLSEIHAARGDADKALGAAWNGAHTRPRDTEIWSRIAGMLLDRDEEKKPTTLRDAIYCYTRIISVDKNNIEARYQRAALNRQLGRLKQVAVEYEQLVKCLPHDTTVLRHLAQVSIELNEPERALRHYKTTVSYLQDVEPMIAKSFTWSDVNVLTELHIFSQQYDEGFETAKSLSRWLLGRRDDDCWENFADDDREWDIDDEPRRITFPDFVPDRYEAKTYGSGLPLDLRIKFGIFRLQSKNQNVEEAMNHFQWLDPHESRIEAKLFDYPDLFRDAATALSGKGLHQEAIRYYEPLQQVVDQIDASYLRDLAKCYLATGQNAEAEGCYRSLLDFEKGNSNDDSEYEGRRGEVCMDVDDNNGEGMISEYEEISDSNSVISEDLEMLKTHAGLRANDHNSTTEVSNSTMLAPIRTAKRAIGRSSRKKSVHRDDLQSLYAQRQALARFVCHNQLHLKEQWMSINKSLIGKFMAEKIFFPDQRHLEFMGYTRQARHLANRKIREKNATVPQVEKDVGDRQMVVPNDFGGIAFENWLDVFLQYGLALAIGGQPEEAYKVMIAATQVNVFYHSPDSLFLIHVCWCTCALLSNDNETLCGVVRWFMKDYQFTSDAYRLFSSVNRLSDCDHGWFNCGPSQKHVLRQVKAMDFSLASDGTGRSNNQERSAYTARDPNGDTILPRHMDVSLLMLYGHILYAGKSYAYANNYFLRALSVDSANPIIKLSLALGYIHHALKRQAENRHQLLMQGIAFLFEYYHHRQEKGGSSERQEAAYNVARVYQMLGLTNLATPYYEDCLILSESVQKENAGTEVEDFAQEAAFTLQQIWATNGNEDRALEVTEQWLEL